MALTIQNMTVTVDTSSIAEELRAIVKEELVKMLAVEQAIKDNRQFIIDSKGFTIMKNGEIYIKAGAI